MGFITNNIIVNLLPTESHDRAVEAYLTMRELEDQIAVTKANITRLKKNLKEWVDKNGPIDLGDLGKYQKTITTQKYIPFSEFIVDELSDSCTTDEIFSSFAMTKERAKVLCDKANLDSKEFIYKYSVNKLIDRYKLIKLEGEGNGQER